MAQMIEAQGKAFFMKCKGAALLITAVSGLVLGLLNWFKEVRDPRVKTAYQELSKSVENLSNDTRKLTDLVRQQGEEISTLQNWVIHERDRRNAAPSATMLRIQAQTKSRPKITLPPVRKPEAWDQVQKVRGD